MVKQAFLFLSHLSSKEVVKEFQNIARSTCKLGSAFFLYHFSGLPIPSEIEKLSPYLFSNEVLTSLNYNTIGSSIVPGHAHFPICKFFADNPDFDYYWVIEYDVRFSGNWQVFFDACLKEDADFLTCHIRSYTEEPSWPWWELCHERKSIPLCDRIRSFNPIYRISKSSLSFLHQELSSGWSGHFEVSMPTLLNYNGYKVKDIADIKMNDSANNNSKFYTSGGDSMCGSLKYGTMRYRPPFWLYGWQKNKLYHPVKPFKKAVKAYWIFLKEDPLMIKLFIRFYFVKDKIRGFFEKA